MKTLYLFIFVSVIIFLASCAPKPIASVNNNTTGDSLSFIVIGDWGVGGTPAQKRLASVIDDVSQRNNVKFIITTGDNFYPAGVQSTEDPHWDHSFNWVYNKKGHMLPWYPTLGNHDYNGKPSAEIAYSRINDRWKMNASYYSFRKNVGKATAVFAFADINPFIKSYYKEPMPELKNQDTAAQAKWLDETLSPPADWKILISHQPLYSMGSHGSSTELIKRFKPFLLQTGTHFYLAGHDHNLQHIQIENEPVHYLVSGGGGRGLYAFKKTELNPLFAASSHGFLLMTLYAKKAILYFYNDKGELLYHYQVQK